MNQGEIKLAEFQHDMSGSFYRSFFEAAFRADESNLKRLGLGFPEEIQALRRYRNEDGYWERLKKEFSML